MDTASTHCFIIPAFSTWDHSFAACCLHIRPHYKHPYSVSLTIFGPNTSQLLFLFFAATGCRFLFRWSGERLCPPESCFSCSRGWGSWYMPCLSSTKICAIMVIYWMVKILKEDSMFGAWVIAIHVGPGSSHAGSHLGPFSFILSWHPHFFTC